MVMVSALPPPIRAICVNLANSHGSEIKEIRAIRVVATTPRKDPQPNISDLRDHSQSIFRPILTRIQKKKKKKKKLPPLYIDQLKCGIRPPRPYPPDPTPRPPPPRRFLGDHFMRERKEVET